MKFLMLKSNERNFVKDVSLLLVGELRYLPRCGFYATIIALTLFCGCNVPEPHNKFHDETIRAIATLADQRDTEALLSYLSNPDPIIRAEAAMAFASVRDTIALHALRKCLNDTCSSVRAAAAYSLGQTPHYSSLCHLPSYLIKEKDSLTYQNLAEALGKCIGQLHTDTAFAPAIEHGIESLLIQQPASIQPTVACARASFWMNLGGYQPKNICTSLANTFGSADVITRRWIASALARCRGDWLSDSLSTSTFLLAMQIETDPITLLNGLTVAGKVKSRHATELIRHTLLQAALPHEIKIAACRAAQRNQSINVEDILPILETSHESLQEEALIAMESKIPSEKDWKQLLENEVRFSSRQLARSMRLKCKWFETSKTKTPKLETPFNGLPEQECLQRIENETNVYTRLEWIRTLGMSPTMADHIYQKALTTSEILEMNAYTEAYILCNKQAQFPDVNRYAETLVELCKKDDVGVTALCATELRELPLAQDEKKKFTEVLESLLARLTIPREVETANELIRTINPWGIKTLEEIKVPHNHPLDWNLIQQIPRRQQAVINTNRGAIIIELHVDQAPGSVSNFIQLVKSGFYDGKTFHRMVPNFVVQGGCPRGDGMGSTDYTIRSEFQLHDYSEGSVGLASSGPDTESCQWFITHIPTPHLEGRYTIFAHVVQGMDVVKSLQIGDTIEKVELR